MAGSGGMAGSGATASESAPASSFASPDPQSPSPSQLPSPSPSPPSSPQRVPLVCVVEHGRDVLGEDAQAASREFLLTNGVGGYASASLACTLTRSYHGLLVAALRPPLDRTLLLSAIDDAALYLGRAYVLAPHPFVLAPPPPPHPHPHPPTMPQTPPPPAAAQASSVQAQHGADGRAASPSLVPPPLQPPTSPIIRVRSSHRSTDAESPLDLRQDAVLASAGVLRAMHCRHLLSHVGPRLPSLKHDAPCIVTASSLESFRLEGTMPVFTYALADALLEKRIWLKRSENAVFIRYSLVRASRPLALSLDAMVNHRNHHSRTLQSRPGFSHSTCSPSERTVVIDFRSNSASPGRERESENPTRLVLRSTRGRADIANTWVHGGDLHRERERGLPTIDDHLHAACFAIDLVPGSSVTIVAAAYEGKDDPGDGLPQFVQKLDVERELVQYHNWESELLGRFHRSRDRHLRRRAEIAESRLRRLSAKSQSLLVKRCSETPPGSKLPVEILRASVEPAIMQLVLAADQFITERGLGRSIIAGYHWFADWSRDTMIALPGLTIYTGRLDVARAILVTFAKYISRGMLPNRFPDDGRAPGDDEYNTADGTLWYFESIRAYYAASNDVGLLKQLFPLLEIIVEHHCAGTRFGIKMDPQDGLLQAGMDGLALTWMDAKVGDHVFTPRIGKPVELGALWFNALSVMKTFASDLGLESRSEYYSSMAYKTEKGFRHKFWNPRKGYCYDVVDDTYGLKDDSLRPNQLIAASLQWSPLSSEQRLQVVETCAHDLVTSHGLRTLSVDDENYRGVYDGDIFSRDGAYHQGTVWPWLLGPFVVAHLRAYGDRQAARAYLLPLLSTITSAGQGTISEIFDGDAPFRPRGCIAQAWSVAEFLRAWVETEPDMNHAEHHV